MRINGSEPLKAASYIDHSDFIFLRSKYSQIIHLLSFPVLSAVVHITSLFYFLPTTKYLLTLFTHITPRVVLLFIIVLPQVFESDAQSSCPFPQVFSQNTRPQTPILKSSDGY